nr:unnamed protein product [Digitaria exilis]CAB3469915.1 unnamed protein product [Digitaria exilis]
MVPTLVSLPPLRHPQANVQKYKVALCQLLVSPDKEDNLTRARARIEAAADAGSMLIEIWSCPYSLETLPSDAEDIDGGASPSISMLSEVAAARKITIVGGSIPEKASGKVFNTCCVIGPDGHILAKHRKLHLFEIDIPGDIKFKESDAFTGGQEPTVVDTDVGRIGIGICHDIRFPELAMLYRSRARDRDAKSQYMIWGHSSLIGPFGEVLAAAGHEETTAIGEIDLSMIQSTRHVKN